MSGQPKAKDKNNKNAKSTKSRLSASNQSLISGHYIETLDLKRKKNTGGVMETEYQQFVRKEISKPVEVTATTSKKDEECSVTSLHGLSHGHLDQDIEKKRSNFIKKTDTEYIKYAKSANLDFLYDDTHKHTNFEESRYGAHLSKPGDTSQIRPAVSDYLACARYGGSRKDLIKRTSETARVERAREQEELKRRKEKAATSMNPDNRDRPYPYRNFDTQDYFIKTPRTGLKPIPGASKDNRFSPNIPPSKAGIEHDEFQRNKARMQTTAAPYQTDELTVWQRGGNHPASKTTLEDRLKGRGNRNRDGL